MAGNATCIRNNQMTMPILDGGGIHALVKETLANEKKAEADLETAKRKAAADARSAFAGIASGIAQIDALQSAVASGDQSFTDNRVGYQLGIRINSDVLDAERQLYSSRRDLAKARYDTLFLGLQLKAAVGGLSAGDIGVINTLLAGSKLTTAMPAKSEQGSAEYAQ